jgi:hypothetical protein
MSPRLLRPRAGGVTGDSDVRNYIGAVEAADGQPLEQGVKDAISTFILGCKTDNIWPAIQASCILIGARTLSGALTPLVGTAPTNVNFVSGDYNRKTGLVGNGSTKYLNTNRNNNADQQDSFHLALWGTDQPNNTNCAYAGAGFDGSTTSSGASLLRSGAGFLITSCRSSGSDFFSPSTGAARSDFANTLFGITRSGSTAYTQRNGSAQTTASVSSQSPFSGNIFVFAASNASGSPAAHANNRMAFYSTGTNLALSTLQSRVSALVTAIGAAIP